MTGSGSLGTATIGVAGVIDVTAPEGLAGKVHSWWSLVEQFGHDKALTDPRQH